MGNIKTIKVIEDFVTTFYVLSDGKIFFLPFKFLSASVYGKYDKT